MCGRAYETYTEEELAVRYGWEKLKRDPLGIKPNYNLSPTQLSPVVFLNEDKADIEMMRFGLVPAWAKDPKDAAKYSLINAKGEEIHEKRSYKSAFMKRRCIVPLSGFYEWKREGEKKLPFAIHLKDEPIMSVAGVYERWQSKTSGEVVDSFSVVTIYPNSFMEKIHNRMPVILAKMDEKAWLDPDSKEAILQGLMKPCDPDKMATFEVSTIVNSPRNNRPECIAPLAK